MSFFVNYNYVGRSQRNSTNSQAVSNRWSLWQWTWKNDWHDRCWKSLAVTMAERSSFKSSRACSRSRTWARIVESYQTLLQISSWLRWEDDVASCGKFRCLFWIICIWWCNDNNFTRYRVQDTRPVWDISSERLPLVFSLFTLEFITSLTIKM